VVTNTLDDIYHIVSDIKGCRMKLIRAAASILSEYIPASGGVEWSLVYIEA
jgi:hypothetical protein